MTVKINMIDIKETFKEVLAYLEHMVAENKITAVAFDTWLSRLEPVSSDENSVTLRAPSEWAKSTVLNRYNSLISEAFLNITGTVPEIKIISDEDTVEDSTPSSENRLTPQKYEYTFENFIVGKSNEFARAAALGVAQNPGREFNPLFIHGPSGLGKTHLIHAIGNRIKHDHPDTNIVYVTGEMFTNELIEAIQKQDTASFRNKFRTADVLLVDDVQFISGKESTQEEFFHTFNELHSHGSQIVITSDRPPKAIKTLEDRIKTRFEWGLISDIGFPEYETRVAIINSKADEMGLYLSDEISSYMATRLNANVRQLEGCIKKISAYQQLMNTPPTLVQVQNIIREILSDDDIAPIGSERIINDVAQVYSLKAEDIRSKSRAKQVSTARKVAAYVIKEMTNASLMDIGADLGGRDHATVSFYINDISKQVKNDDVMRVMIEDIIMNIKKTASGT